MTITTHITNCGARFASDTEIGLAYTLTACCHASGKGGDSPSGVVCRNCYAPVPSYHGVPLNWWIAVEHVAAQRCPIPEDCATDTLWLLESA